MKKLLCAVLVVVMTQMAFSQVVFKQTDSVDVLALKWLNAYRSYHKAQQVKLDDSRKTNARHMTKWISDTIKATNRVRLVHTKEHCAEALTGSPFFWSVDINDTTSKFALFVAEVFKRKISDLTGVDCMILSVIHTWDQSNAGHREMIRDTKYKLGYFSLAYIVNIPGKIKNTIKNGVNPQAIDVFGRQYGTQCVRMSYAASLQFQYAYKDANEY